MRKDYLMRHWTYLKWIYLGSSSFQIKKNHKKIISSKSVENAGVTNIKKQSNWDWYFHLPLLGSNKVRLIFELEINSTTERKDPADLIINVSKSFAHASFLQNYYFNLTDMIATVNFIPFE